MTATPELMTVTIGHLGKFITVKTPPSSSPESFGNAYPFITPTDIQSDRHWVKTERFLSEKGMESQKRLLLP